ncbi:MAG: cell wall-binding repeat-containing protein [Euzebyales bacterium]|jgi:uncharacterized protein with LGFP repeats|nr:cell wall-binding repeat-containing protein [Euzebyales bacterium]
MFLRSTTIAALAAALLCFGLLAPVSAQPGAVIPETATAELDGLPVADDRAADPDTARFAANWSVSESVATMPFSFVGFELPQDAEAAFRTSADGQAWTSWTTMDTNPDEGPDPGSPERRAAADGVMSEGVWVGEARFVQARVMGASVNDLGVHLIDTAGLGRNVAQRAADAVAAAWRGTPGPAVATVGGPPIISRAQWGAEECVTKGSPSYAQQVELGVVHHTAGSNSYSESDAPAVVRGICRYHTQSNGWDDIGYNVLVDRYGNVYEGRAGGLERGVIGAHAGGFNTGTFGVSVLGEFTGWAPPAVAQEAVARVLAWKYDMHHIDAAATVVKTSAGSTKYPAGQDVTLSAGIGHRDVSSTTCPGDAFYARLGWLEDRALQLSDDMFVQPSVSPDRVRVSDQGVENGPVTLSAGLKPSGSWSVSVRDPSGAVVHSANGSGSTASTTWQPAGAPLGTYTYEFTGGDRRPARGDIHVSNDAVKRIAGSENPTTASVSLSKAAFSDAGSASHGVIARSDVFADAMTGGPLAGTDGPLLLTGGASLDRSVTAELERVLPAGAPVYLLGGEGALSPQIEAALEGHPRGWDVVRLGGKERAATSARVAEVVLARSGQGTAMVARYGPDDKQPWADALSGGAYGAREGIPVLLSLTNQLPKPLDGVLAGLDDTIVLGGTAAISSDVAGQLPSPRRVNGKDRAGTAAAVAAQLWERTSGADGDRFVVGGGYSSGAWAYALAGAPLAAKQDAPLLLVLRDSVPPETESYLEGLGYSGSRSASGWVLGPETAVNTNVADEISGLLR